MSVPVPQPAPTTNPETTRVAADDIPTEITRMTYRTTQSLSAAGLPILSQNQTAVLLAHYWPAIEAHFRNLLADEIETKSQALLDALPEDEVRPSDWDQHEEWLEAASSIRRPDAYAAAAVPATTTTPQEN